MSARALFACAVMGAGCAGVGCAPAPSRALAPPASVSVVAVGARAPQMVDTTREGASAAWTAYLEGRPDAAVLMARAREMAERTARSGGPRTPRGYVADGGAAAIVAGERQILFADRKTGKIRGAVDVPDFAEIDVIEGTPLVVGHDRGDGKTAQEGLSVLDVRLGEIVARFDRGQAIAVVDHGKTLVVAEGAPEHAPASIVVFGVDDRKILRRIVAEGIPDVMTLAMFDSDKIVMPLDDHGPLRVAYEIATGAEVLRQPGGYALGLPAFSANGRIAAFISSRGDEGEAGVVTVIDPTTRKVLGQTRAIPQPRDVALSPNGTLLAVGDPSRAWVLEVPKLRVVGKTPPQRGSAPPEWDPDLDRVEVFLVDDGRALVTGPATGWPAIHAVPSLQTLWRGEGQLMTAKDGTPTIEVASPVSASHTTVVTVAPGPRIAKRVRSEFPDLETTPASDDPIADLPHSLVAAIDAQLCHVGAWLLPKPACAPR